MKLSTAIKRLKKDGYSVKGNLGSYIAVRGNTTISFYETGSGNSSKFIYRHTNSCSPTYGMSLKAAMS